MYTFSVELFCLICNENQYTDYQSLNLLLMHLVKVCIYVCGYVCMHPYMHSCVVYLNCKVNQH